MGSLTRDVGDAVGGGVARGADRDLAAVSVAYDEAAGRAGAAQGIEELVLPVALEARHAHDLARVDRHVACRASASEDQAAGAQNDGSRLRICTRRLGRDMSGEAVGAGHEPDEIGRGPLISLEGRHRAARSHHGDAI